MTEQSRSTAPTSAARPVVRENEFAAGSGRVVGAEEQTGQRVGVDVALESHRGAALDVQDDAVPVVAGRRDRLVAGHLPGQVEEEAPVEPVQPGEVVPEVTGVKPTARNAAYVRCLAGQRRRARELPELRFGRGDGRDLLLPSFRRAGRSSRM